MLAILSVNSGEVTDLKRLQDAEKYLSGANTARDEVHTTELNHNLTMVRKLLQQEQNQEQNQQQQTGSGEQQQENQEQLNTS